MGSGFPRSLPLLFGLVRRGSSVGRPRGNLGLVASACAGLLLLATATPALAMCDVIPQQVLAYRGALGSLDRPFAAPGDPIQISLDPAGCDPDGSGFASNTADVTTDFSAGLDGWQEVGFGSHQYFVHESTGGNPGGWIHGKDSTSITPAGMTGPSVFYGDWSALGVTSISWDHKIPPVCVGTDYLYGNFWRVQIGGPGGRAGWRITSPSESAVIPLDGTWGHFDLPISPSAPTGNWEMISGDWQALLSDVNYIYMLGELRNSTCDEYGIDNVTIHESTAGEVATLIFTPPGGPPSALVVAPPVSGACTSPAMTTELAACASELGTGADVSCVTAADFANTVDRLSFSLPDLTVAGVPRSGPAKIAVSPLGEALPCEMATLRCADTANRPGNLRACVDELYEADGTCSTADQPSPARTFSAFTALPDRNEFQRLCTPVEPGSPCVGDLPPLEATTDRDGNLLVPFLWSEVLVDPSFPTPRLVRLATDTEAFPGGGTPVSVPGTPFYHSYSLRGQPLPPFFEEVVDPSGDTAFLGTVDAPRGVLRFLRRSPLFRECRDDGTHQILSPGVPCTKDTDCPTGASCGEAVCYQSGAPTAKKCVTDAACSPGQECGPSLFDFTTRYASSTGPVTISSYAAEAQNPVPLDGLLSTDQAILSVRSEPIEAGFAGADLNGDMDTKDVAVVSLRDPESGQTLDLGGMGVVGPAGARVEKLPLEIPATALEGNLAAWLRSRASDENAESLENVLDVVRVDAGAPGGFVDLTPSPEPVADPAPLVNDRPLVVSNGRVFFRASEFAGLGLGLARVDRSAAGDVPDQPIDVLDGAGNIVGGWDIDDDGRWVVFSSAASTIGSLVNASGDPHVYLLDRDSDGNGVFDENGGVAYREVPRPCTFSAARRPAISGDGRFVVYDEDCSGGSTPRIVLHDRDLDENGVFDDGSAGSGYLSACVTPASSTGEDVYPSVSDDGLRIAFQTLKTTYTGGSPTDDNSVSDVVVFDRSPGLPSGCWPGTFRFVSKTPIAVSPPKVGNGASYDVHVSGDGQWIVFTSQATNIEWPNITDTNGQPDVLAQWTGGGSIRYLSQYRNAAGSLVAGNGFSQFPSVSRDGRIVAFTSSSTDLARADFSVRGAHILDRDPDGDGVFDENLYLATGAPQRRPSDVFEYAPLVNSWSPVRGAVSPDGRYVGLVGLFPPSLTVTQRYDRLTRTSLTGLIENPTHTGDLPLVDFPPPVSVSENALDLLIVRPDCNGPIFAVNCDGGASDLDFQGFVRTIDRGDLTNDRNADGDPLDAVLSVYDPGTGQVHSVAAADRVSVAGDRAAFLLPEASENGASRCAGFLGGQVVAGGCDLNWDGDASDAIVFLYNAATDTLENTGFPADDVVLSTDWIVALAPSGGTAPMAYVRPVAYGTFTPLDFAVDTDVRGDVVVLLTPEADAGVSLNGDGDTSDVVVQLFDPATASPLALNDGSSPLPNPSAVDFVLGDSLLALRTFEYSEGTILNGDGDQSDAVLQVVDLPSLRLLNTGKAAFPCPVEACDPATPYRVTDRRVAFIVREVDQSDSNGVVLAPGCSPTTVAGQCDLDGDGSARGYVVEYYNPDKVLNGMTAAEGASPAGEATFGVCTDTGEGCSEDADCASGRCIVPPGSCVGPVGPACNPTDGGIGVCDPDVGEYCDAATSQCFQASGPCRLDADCGAGELCLDLAHEERRVSSPLPGEGSGRPGQTSRGACVQTLGGFCSSPAECPMGASCSPDGVCERREGSCASADQCPDGFLCEPRPIFAADADTDGDGVPDSADDCKGRANPDQLDTDGDGLGDACDRQTCGNGIQEYDEECDHGAQNGQDGLCDTACAYVGGTAACANGVDDDGDGLIDLADPGCADAADTSERRPDIACDDGVDNDGDYGVDRFGDPGCAGASSQREAPQCSNGIDDDGDRKIDFDGAGLGSPDPQCSGPSDNREAPDNIKRCGLGFELAFLVPLLRLLLLRQRRVRG
jgi:WD40-like Beta Propeller Repeat